MQNNVALIRLNALPLGSGVEIEMNCDSARIEADKLDKLWRNNPRQVFYTTPEAYMNAPQDANNVNGEVYFHKDKMSREEICQIRGKAGDPNTPQSNLLGVTAIIPALDIINVMTGESQTVCERYNHYQ